MKSQIIVSVILILGDYTMGVPKDDMAQYGTDPVDAKTDTVDEAAVQAAVELTDVTTESDEVVA